MLWLQTIIFKILSSKYYFNREQKYMFIHQYQNMQYNTNKIDSQSIQMWLFNLLLLQKSNQNSWDSKLIILTKFWKKKLFVSQNHKNPIWFRNFSGSNIRNFGKRSFCFLSNAYFRSFNQFTNMSVFGYFSKKNLLKKDFILLVLMLINLKLTKLQKIL